MKKLLISLTACSLAVSACTTPSAGTSGVQATADVVVLNGTKALVIATDAYTAAANAAAVAVKAGHLNNDQLRMIDTLNDQALAYINGADTALSVAQRAAGLSLVVTQLHSILGK